MFLFRFVKYIKFRMSEKAEAWQVAYDRLCDETDFLYLRKKEQKSFIPTAFFLILYSIILWWLSTSTLFASTQMIIVTILFSVVSLCYLLTIYTYIPMEIEVTSIHSRMSASRKPSSVVRKRLQDMELKHQYYIYTTMSNKKAIDMVDRIFGVDQEYSEGETVFCFSGINNEFCYILPKIEE